MFRSLVPVVARPVLLQRLSSTMKASSWALVAAVSLQAVPVASFAFCRPPCVLALPSSSRRMSDGDDWFSDYDPTVYERRSDEYSSSRTSFNDRRPSSRSSSGGGGGHGHGYTRDTSRDRSNVDEDAVNDLLTERLHAKKRRDFDTADAIREQLTTDHAVGVDDRERTWRTGCSPSGSGMKRGSGYRSGNDRNGRSTPKRSIDFGPNGHDYDKSSDAGPNSSSLSDEEIHAQIAQRLRAKLSRDFSTADRIQDELNDAGVFVHDGAKEWRADGSPFGDLAGRGGKPGRTRDSRSDRNRPYAKSKFSIDIEGEAEDEIATLVEERSSCKASRDYMNADRIRDDLQERFDVHVDDRSREWSVGGDFGNETNNNRAISQAVMNRRYVKSKSSADLDSAEDEKYVQAKMEERQEAKKIGAYNLADSIRDDLLDEFDVTINDRLRQWSVGGDFGDDLAPKRLAEYTRRGGGDLSDEDVATIELLVAKRTQAKKDRHFKTADEIRDQLRETYKVTFDDRSREWRVDTDEYVQSSVGMGSNKLSEDMAALIQSKVEERAEMKRLRDYDAADAIRDDLRHKYSVTIDDRTKEWNVVEDGVDEFRDNLAADTLNGQNSAYKRKEFDDDLDEALSAIFDDESNEDEDQDECSPVSFVEEKDEVAEAREMTASSSLSFDELMTRTVVDLRDMLRDAGKPISGKKSELVERLLE